MLFGGGGGGAGKKKKFKMPNKTVFENQIVPQSI
jgi:hypothetical protein